MRVQLEMVTALVVVALVISSPPQARSATRDPGRLSGVTQITYGCPGPQREGEACEHWFSFPQARFRVTESHSGGAVRTITSDRRGRFTLALAAGVYRL